MSKYIERSNYFETLATNNKLIAHGRPVSDGDEKLRKSFFRINDLDELETGCRNWAHFPCMVHVGHDIQFKQLETGLPRKVIGNHLYFLTKAKAQNSAEEMEQAYDVAETVMSQILSFMNEEMEENMRCGNLFLFDLKGAHAEQIGPFNNNLYGWHIIFYDETKSCELGYKNDDWFTPVDGGIDRQCGCDDDTDQPGETTGPSGEVIYFYGETIVDVELTDLRKAIVGNAPIVQVWFKDEEEDYYVLASVPTKIYGTPENKTLIRVYNTGEATGYITLKRSV